MAIAFIGYSICYISPTYPADVASFENTVIDKRLSLPLCIFSQNFSNFYLFFRYLCRSLKQQIKIKAIAKLFSSRFKAELSELPLWQVER